MGLVRTGFIPIPPGAKPGFDHADLYRDASGVSRLYVAQTGADRVDAGPVFAVVHPRAVSLHRLRPEGSARNAWPGSTICGNVFSGHS